MKGVILDCLKNLVSNQYGTDKWQDIMKMSGLKLNQPILVTVDLEDEVAVSLINSTCKVLNVSIQQASEAYGEYWMRHYASKIYAAYMYDVKTSRDLLLKLDTIHTKVTNSMPNATPPKFLYEWKNDKTLRLFSKKL